MQISGRHDRYKTVSTSELFIVSSPDEAHSDPVYSTNNVSSTDGLISLRYSPVKGLALRGSHSSGFLPPSLDQIQSIVQFAPAAGLVGTIDPRRGDTPLIGDANGEIREVLGGNPNLEPEDSTSVSFGVVLEPQFLPGIRFSVDYTRIRKTSEIVSPQVQEIIDNEALYPGRVVRGENLDDDPPEWAGPIIGIDSSFLNATRSTIEAIDFQLDHTLRTAAAGDFHGYAVASHQTDLRRSFLSGAPAQYAGYADGPLSWRGNIGLDWTKGPLSIGWNMQFYDNYFIYGARDSADLRALLALNQGSERIPSQTYHDLLIGYRFEEKGTLLGGSEISFGVQNLFNQQPPVIASISDLGVYSTYGDPRLRRYSIAIRKSFGVH
jgi:iron complex outermembrane recepter protein